MITLDIYALKRVLFFQIYSEIFRNENLLLKFAFKILERWKRGGFVNKIRLAMVIIELGYMCQEPLNYSIYFNVILKFSTIKCQKINKLKNDIQGILELNGFRAKILAFR